jgi:hypothetical protein
MRENQRPSQNASYAALLKKFPKSSAKEIATRENSAPRRNQPKELLTPWADNLNGDWYSQCEV